jgi:hypothetical protein
MTDLAHSMHEGHEGHDHAAGIWGTWHTWENLKQKFWISLIITIPDHFAVHIYGRETSHFSFQFRSDWVVLILSTICSFMAAPLF